MVVDKTNSEKPDMDICTECAAKQQDRTFKPVTSCYKCNRMFCEYHLRPKLVHIPDFGNASKQYKINSEIIRTHNNFEGGHPCSPYTTKFWQQHDTEQARNEQKITKNIDRMLSTPKLESEKLLLKTKKISPTINYPFPKQRSKTKLLKKIAVVFALVIIAILLLWYAYPILQQLVQNSSAPNVPALTTPYVEVKYQTVGWFYSTTEGTLYSNDYNYTYLVLDIIITNYGYSQVNVIGTNGFSVLVNNDEYTPLISISNSMYNGSISSFYNTQKSYFFTSKLPSEAILLNTGSVNGTIVFKFGSPNVYPQQSQILNKPFVLQYSVSYGDSVPLWVRQVYESGPYAKVIINQTG